MVLIKFPDNIHCFVCRTCGTHVAMYKHLVTILVTEPESRKKNVQQVQPDTSVLLLHMFNFDWSIREIRRGYEGTPVTCKNCYSFLGYRITEVINQQNLDLAVGYFDLDMCKLFVNDQLSDAHKPVPVRYTPDKNFYQCRMCKTHLAMEYEFLGKMPETPEFGIFRDSDGVLNVYLGAPYFRLDERRSAVHCSGCYTNLGYKIDELRDVVFVGNFLENGRFILNLMKLQFFGWGKLHDPLHGKVVFHQKHK